jgi:hypothetical protein
MTNASLTSGLPPNTLTNTWIERRLSLTAPKANRRCWSFFPRTRAAFSTSAPATDACLR